MQLNRPLLAKEYLKQFSTALPAASELARLQARFGSAFFLELSTQEALQPEGTVVADAVMQAADARIRDAQRLAGLVDRWRLRMRRPGGWRWPIWSRPGGGDPTLVQALADPAKRGPTGQSSSACAIGPSAVAPLTAALGSTDQNLQIAVLGALGELKSREAVPHLLVPAWKEDGDAAVREAAQRALQTIVGSVPSRSEALSFLSRRLDAFLAGTAPAAVDEHSHVTLWMWDAAQQLLLSATGPRADAAFLTAAQSAEYRYLVDPAAEDYRSCTCHALELASAGRL